MYRFEHSHFTQCCINQTNNYSTNDELQFLMLTLSDIRVCSNSTFSLMSCYFNEIFEFKKKSEYIFPHKWFGTSGPKFNLDEFKSRLISEIN